MCSPSGSFMSPEEAVALLNKDFEALQSKMADVKTMAETARRFPASHREIPCNHLDAYITQSLDRLMLDVTAVREAIEIKSLAAEKEQIAQDKARLQDLYQREQKLTEGQAALQSEREIHARAVTRDADSARRYDEKIDQRLADLRQRAQEFAASSKAKGDGLLSLIAKANAREDAAKAKEDAMVRDAATRQAEYEKLNADLKDRKAELEKEQETFSASSKSIQENLASRLQTAKASEEEASKAHKALTPIHEQLQKRANEVKAREQQAREQLAAATARQVELDRQKVNLERREAKYLEDADTLTGATAALCEKELKLAQEKSAALTKIQALEQELEHEKEKNVALTKAQTLESDVQTLDQQVQGLTGQIQGFNTQGASLCRDVQAAGRNLQRLNDRSAMVCRRANANLVAVDRLANAHERGLSTVQGLKDESSAFWKKSEELIRRTGFAHAKAMDELNAEIGEISDMVSTVSVHTVHPDAVESGCILKNLQRMMEQQGIRIGSLHGRLDNAVGQAPGETVQVPSSQQNQASQATSEALSPRAAAVDLPQEGRKKRRLSRIPRSTHPSG